MNLKGIRFFNKKREITPSASLSERITSTKAYQALYRQQLKALRGVFGEKTFERVYKKPFKNKTIYWVLESPHANLTALSGHSVADITPPANEPLASIKNGLNAAIAPKNSYTLPSWYSDGTSLFTGFHFENEVYGSNYSFEDTLKPLVDTLGARRHGQRFGGVVIYLHRDDLTFDSTPAWLGKMASFVGQASLVSNQPLPVYIVLEGGGLPNVVTEDRTNADFANMPVSMFRDQSTVLAEQFGQWFSQAQSELTHRLLRKTLKDVQYVHDVDSRRAVFSALNAIEQGLRQLKQVSEHLNHRWHFSGQAIAPWVRAVFLAPNSTPVSVRHSEYRLITEAEASQPQSEGRNQWWLTFSHILVKDRGCGKVEPEHKWRQQSVAIGTAITLVLGLIWSQLMWRDYAHADDTVELFNEQVLAWSASKANDINGSSGFDGILDTLISVKLFDDGLDEEQQIAGWPNALLSQSIEQQQRTLSGISDSLLMNEFNHVIDQTLLDVLVNGQTFDVLYPALKSYLLFHQDRPQRSDYLLTWFSRHWQKAYPNHPEKRQQLAEYLSVLLANQQRDKQQIDPQVDAQQVLIARSKMLETPLAKRMYFEIKQSALKHFSRKNELKDVIGYQQMDVFDNPSVSVPSFYSKLGYQTLFLPKMRQVVEQASADEWVLAEPKQVNNPNNNVDAASLEKEIYELYIADYLVVWGDFLSQLTVAKTGSFDHLTSVLKGASGRDGAIQRVLGYVYDNTHFLSIPNVVNATGAVERASGLVPTSLASSANKATRVLNGVDGYLTEKGMDSIHPMNAVTQHFSPLNAVINNSENKSSAIQAVDRQLVMLEEYISDFDSASNNMSNMTSVFDATVKRIKGSRKDAISQLKRTSRLMPEPLKRWAQSLSGQAWGLMVGQTKHYINDAYENDIVAFYDAHLNKKYPLNTQAEDDISVDRFSEFFKPEGREQAYFNQYLKPFIRTHSKRWTEKSIDGVSLGFKKEYLRQLKRAQDIRKSMFNRQHDVYVELQLQPVYLDANISRFELNLMGERLSYRHGPQKVSKIAWPPNLNEGDITMRFEDYNGNLVTESVTGDWSVFKLIERFGKESSPNGQRFRMSFEVNGQRAVYKASGRTLSPALLHLLSQYRAPLKPLG